MTLFDNLTDIPDFPKSHVVWRVHAVELFTYQTNSNISRLKWDTREQNFISSKVLSNMRVSFKPIFSFHTPFISLRYIFAWASSTYFQSCFLIQISRNVLKHPSRVTKMLIALSYEDPSIVLVVKVILEMEHTVKVGIIL